MLTISFWGWVALSAAAVFLGAMLFVIWLVYFVIPKEPDER